VDNPGSCRRDAHDETGRDGSAAAMRTAARSSSAARSDAAYDRPAWVLATVGLVRGDQLNALLSKAGVELVAVVGLIPDQSGRGIGDKPTLDSVPCKGDFMRRSRCNMYGDRKTIAVCHGHDLRTFAPLGLSHTEPPFFATTKVPSIKHSDRSSLHRLQCPSLHPLLESSMAGLVRGEVSWKIGPRGTGTQYPENAVEYCPIFDTRSATSVHALDPR
jgi:hypothetical protein